MSENGTIKGFDASHDCYVLIQWCEQRAPVLKIMSSHPFSR